MRLLKESFVVHVKWDSQISAVWLTSGMERAKDGMIVDASLALDEWSSLRGKLDPWAAVWGSKWVDLLS